MFNNNEFNLFYRMSNGEVVSRSEINKAFFICSGKRVCEAEDDFLRWLYNKLGRSIVRVERADYFTTEELLYGMNRICAIKIIRVRDDCSVVEASKRYDQMVEDHKKEHEAALMAAPIEDLQPTVHTANCLRRANITTVGHLIHFVKQNGVRGLLRLRNLGKSSVEEIAEILEDYGIKLDTTILGK